MFDQLFQTEFAVTRHKTAPYSVERQRFLEHLAEQGYPYKSIRQLSGMLLRIVHELRDCLDLRANEEQIRAAACRATRGPRGFPKIRKLRPFRRVFVREAKRWLRFLGRYQESRVEPLPFADRLDDFASWMEHERGLSPVTIEKRRWYIASFLRWFGGQRDSISSMRLADIDAYQAACKDRGLSRISIKNQSNAIRAFLRYAGSQEWCSSSIADGIQGPRIYVQENIPSGPSWSEVMRLVSSVDTDRPEDIRN